MDYSAQGGDDEVSIQQTYDANMETVKFAHNNPALSHAVFKVSGLCKVPVMEKANDPMQSFHLMNKHRLTASVIDLWLCVSKLTVRVPVLFIFKVLFI